MKVVCFRGICIGVGFFVYLLALPCGQAAEVVKSPHGPDDEIGVLNELTAAGSLAVLQRVNSGKVYEFAFIAAPIKLRGATGAPIRPLALPIRAEKEG